MSGFKITRGTGFQVTFANGYIVSVQFGPGNYGDNYNDTFTLLGAINPPRDKYESTTAEMALMDPYGNLISPPLEMFGEDTVTNRSTARQMLELMAWAEHLPGVNE